MHLGTNVRDWKYADDNGVDNHCWALGLESYIKEAVRIIKKLMEKHNLSHSSTKRHGRKTPFSNSGYRPELDTTLYCSPELITVYQNIIDIVQWICKLGRLDIIHEVSILSQYLSQPRMGHQQQF